MWESSGAPKANATEQALRAAAGATAREAAAACYEAPSCMDELSTLLAATLLSQVYIYINHA